MLDYTVIRFYSYIYSHGMTSCEARRSYRRWPCAPAHMPRGRSAGPLTCADLAHHVPTYRAVGTALAKVERKIGLEYLNALNYRCQRLQNMYSHSERALGMPVSTSAKVVLAFGASIGYASVNVSKYEVNFGESMDK